MRLNAYNVDSWALPEGTTTVKRSTRCYNNIIVISRHGYINSGDRKFDQLDKPGRRSDFALDYRRWCLRCELRTVFGV